MLKLGPHLKIGGRGVQEWIDAGVATVKLAADFPQLNFRGAIVVGRTFDVHQLDRDRDILLSPEGVAGWYFDTNVRRAIELNPHVTHWSGPNEFIIETPGQMEWYARFLYQFARQVRAYGRTPVIGGWSVGNPRPNLWGYYWVALEACKDFGAIFERHSYGPLTEEYALRHRMDKRIFDEMGYRNVKFLITECGADNAGGMTPWKTYYGGDFDRYWNEWIAPFERAIRVDEYVLGAHLFTLGDGGSSPDRESPWRAFDVADTDIARRMVELSRQLGDLPTMYTSLIGKSVKVRYNKSWLAISPTFVGTNPIILNKTRLYAETVFPDVKEEVGDWLRVSDTGWVHRSVVSQFRLFVSQAV